MNLPQRVYDFFVANLGFFARTFGKAGALAFLGEAGAHVWILTTPFRFVDLPFWADWYFLLLGGYGAIFMWLFRTAMVPRCGDPEVRVIATLFITISVLLHLYIIVVHDHAILRVFGRSYSYLGLTYCIFFALRFWTLETRITPARGAAS
jgi:hypothetical protein